MAAIDWPSACAAPQQGAAAAVGALATLSAAWSAAAQGSHDGGLPSVPSVYRLPGDGVGAASDSDSTAG